MLGFSRLATDCTLSLDYQRLRPTYMYYWNPVEGIPSKDSSFLSGNLCGSFVHFIHYRREAFSNKPIILDLFCWWLFTLCTMGFTIKPPFGRIFSELFPSIKQANPSKVYLVRFCPFNHFIARVRIWISSSITLVNSHRHGLEFTIFF